MQTRRKQQSPNYRQMAADGLRLARKATSELERERYMLATAFFVKRALEIEKRLNTGADVSPAVEAMLTEKKPLDETPPPAKVGREAGV